MKKLFTAIRQKNNDLVREILEKKPELISCTAKQPPKKDDGQSPLQVALKVSNYEVIELLLDMNADIHFMESEDYINKWRAPVIHDAIIAAVMCSRWNTTDPFKVHNTKTNADTSFEMLKRIVGLGADVNAKDSFGGSCIGIAIGQARQILPTYNHTEKRLHTDRVLTDELRADLSRIFDLLIKNGADVNYKDPNLPEPPLKFFEHEPVLEFIT